MTQQGKRQQSFRDFHGGPGGTYQEDIFAAAVAAGIPPGGTCNECLLALANATMGTSFDNINDGLQAWAEANGAYNWSSTGEIVFGQTLMISDGTPNPQTEGTGNSITFTVSATQEVTEEITFNYETIDETAVGGGAGDFAKIPSTAGSLTPGSPTLDIVVSMTAADAVWKPDRSFLVRLSGGSVQINKADGRGWITDSLAAPTFSIGDGVPDPAEQGTHTSQSFTVTATQAGGVDYLVDFATRNGSAPSGSFTPKSGTATVTAGATTVPIDVTINASPLAAGVQNYFVDISNARATLGSVTENLTITDATGQGNIKGADAISMGDGTPSPQTEATPAGIDFAITSSGTPPLPTDVTGTWRTVNGTAVAGEPGDFTGVTSAPFTIPAATGTVTVNVALEAADSVWAPDRSFTAEIVTSDAPISDPSGTGTITDSLTKPTISISDGVPNPAIKGTHPTITFTLTAAVAPKYDILVDVVTVDGTASAGTDYTAVNTTVTIPAGQTTATVNVTVLP